MEAGFVKPLIPSGWRFVQHEDGTSTVLDPSGCVATLQALRDAHHEMIYKTGAASGALVMGLLVLLLGPTDAQHHLLHCCCCAAAAMVDWLSACSVV